MWPFGKRKRREAEQDAEYQAFLAAQKKPARVLPRTPTPRPSWWNTQTHRYQGSAVSYGPVDQLSSATYAVYLHEGYPDQAND